jgi:hypothetical protein
MTKIKEILRSIALISATQLLQTSANAVPTLVRGTRVSIDAPLGFEVAQEFPGFAKKDESASLMVTEMPIPVEKLMEGFNVEKLSSRGLILLDKRVVSIDGRKADLISLRQYYGSAPFVKWIASFGAEKSSVMLMASFPEPIATTTGEHLKAAILGAKWSAGDKEVGIFQGLNFELQRSADILPLKQVSGMVLLGRAGELGTSSSTKPVMIVGNVQGPQISAINSSATSKQFILQANRLLNVMFQQESRIKIAGFDAFEIEGMALARTSGAPLAFYQVLIPRATGNLMIYGEVGLNEKQTYFPRFKAVANTLTIK